jgi:pimeloyl-ACP methyl ester carboxylesterase
MSGRKVQLHGARSTARNMPLSLRVMRFVFGRVGAVWPSLVGRWALWLWFRSRRFPESVAGRRAVQDAGREVLRVGTAQVSLYRWGQGPVVWFIHGWSGRGSQVASFVGPLTATGFQVLAPDLPGHGQSSGHSTNIMECAGVLQAMQSRYGAPAAVITHSFGGMVLAFALNHGVRTQRVVCFCPPADAQFLVHGFAQTLGMHDRVVASLCARLEQCFERNFWERTSTVSNVRNLAIPAVLIHDEDDRSVPWQQGEQVAAAWPGARFLKTRGLGHGRILRDAHTVAAAVDFIGGGKDVLRAQPENGSDKT